MFPSKVYLRELGPREGFQTLPQVIPTSSKLELIRLLGQAGVPEIEVTSFVRADRVPQMADADTVVRECVKVPGVKYTALYLNYQGFERAESTARLDNDGWIYIAASETFLKRNNNVTIAETIAKIPQWLGLFKRFNKPLHGVMISTAFGCNYEGPISQERVLDILEQVQYQLNTVGSRPIEISLADTMGWGTPVRVRHLINAVREKFPGSEVSLHLHDTRGSGMANVYAGLEEGIRIIDCSIAGMGGCPFAKGAAGNVPTEDVAFLCQELGIETGVSLDQLCT
ncbi:MAG: hydroxymethylglutaryl-CoA lyase, partial [Proteobacteria bacterium]|nr:hydroxymethylglutaryl-CoA lyase [Pseudomonadota bacterium]